MSTIQDWHDLGLKDDCIGKVLDIGTDEIWVINRGGVFMIVSNICPHKMGPISEGMLEGNVVECPWHGYRFNIDSGVAVSKPCPSLRVYETKIEGGRLFIKEKK